MGKDYHRSKSTGPRYVRHYEWFLDCPAYRSLGVYARALYTELARRYNGSNNGGISLAYREAQALLNCSNKPIPGAFKELQDKGFIKVSQRGSFDWKARRDGTGNGRATTWILTEHAINLPFHVADVPTKEFMRWRPAAQSLKKNTVRPERTIGTLKAGHVSEMARPERTIGTPRAYDNAQKAASDGTLKAGTYSIPDTPAPDGALTPIGSVASTILDTARLSEVIQVNRRSRRAG